LAYFRLLLSTAGINLSCCIPLFFSFIIALN
jgi:hypothetical protein